MVLNCSLDGFNVVLEQSTCGQRGTLVKIQTHESMKSMFAFKVTLQIIVLSFVHFVDRGLDASLSLEL